MVKSTGKKRGRPRKPVLVVRLSDVQPGWEARLRRAGLPKEIHRSKELQQDAIPPNERDALGRRIRPTKVVYGESWNHRSVTQKTDPMLSLYEEAAANESTVLSPVWKHYLEYMNVISEARSPKDNGAELKNLFLKDARSRSWEQPPKIPAELGTPAEFKERLADHEMELRYTVNRRETTIRIRVYQLPPHEDEDLDPSEEPAGHWEALKWIPDPPK
jgi:hypothetical protein